MRSGNFRTTSFALGPENIIKIHYYRSQPVQAEGSRPSHRTPVLLLHGYPQTSFMWKEVVRKMSGKYDLVVPDLRGELRGAGNEVGVFRQLGAEGLGLVYRIWKEFQAKRQ
jgi:hypothetical protein